MEINELTPEKSLQIISESIRKSRRDFEKDAGKPLIIWGLSVLFISFVVWLTWKITDNPAYNLIWFSTIIVWIIFAIVQKKKDKGIKARNFLGEMIGYVWISYGIFAIGLSVVICLISQVYVDSPVSIKSMSQFLTLIFCVLLGFSALITGILVKNKSIIFAGLIIGLGSPVAYYYLDGADLTLMMSIASFFTLLIPGIILNIQSKKE